MCFRILAPWQMLSAMFTRSGEHPKLPRCTGITCIRPSAPWLLMAEGSSGVFSISNTAPSKLGLSFSLEASARSAAAACSATSGLPLRRARAIASGQWACSVVTARSSAALSRTGAGVRSGFRAYAVGGCGRARGLGFIRRAADESRGAAAGSGAAIGAIGAAPPQAVPPAKAAAYRQTLSTRPRTVGERMAPHEEDASVLPVPQAHSSVVNLT
jgi:hypothetical protein